ncbi:MAG: hypothetical protein COX19_15710 [Desulfobacterales bacterium CG23_combo_of_CG06-09_8_20_14_all_51_8]|nr:MAG: hypothetical protein COX19_15710 [Desulfobacterales bacterium CG23_combo_of_CG06-09_8_20_14_all_51_8]
MKTKPIAKIVSRLSRAVLIAGAVFLWPASVLYARPTAAIIYPNDAKITEHLSVDVISEKDRSRASFFLPIHAVQDTLTVDTGPGAGMIISSVTVLEQTLPYADEAQALKNKLKALHQKKSEYETRIKAATATIDFWQTRAKTQPKTPESVDSVEKLGQAIGRGITAAYDEIFQHNQSLEDLAEQINDVQKELDDLTGAARKRWQVTVYFSGAPKTKPGGPIDLVCTYHIQNCGWRSAYTINALPENAETRLGWYAEITRNTGIDWEGVALTIATARVVTRPEPPFLRDWIIAPHEPVDYPMAQRKAVMSEEVMMMAAPQEDADKTGGAPPEPEQAAGFTFDTYDLGNHAIKSGETRRVTIRDLTLKSDFKYLVRPQADPQAFLFAQIDVKDADFIKLPEGDATFLVDSAFIANRLFSMQDKEQKVFFGSDPQVDVKLTILDKKSNETGFLMGKKHFQWGWKVSVNNLKAQKIDILMEDAAPQIRDDRIKLKELFDATAPEKEDNTLKWTFSVPAHEEKTVEYGFSITYPDDMTLSFGGR